MPDKDNGIITTPRTKITPEVNYDRTTNSIRISGESSPENALEFYIPIIEWVKRTLELTNIVQLTFDLTYFNTSSAKQIIYLFDILDEYYQKGYEVSVVWVCATGDLDMVEAGEELLEGLYFPYSIVR